MKEILGTTKEIFGKIKDILSAIDGISIGSFSLSSLLRPIVVLLVCRIAVRMIMRLFTRAIGRTRLDDTLKNFACTAVRFLLWALTVIITADSLGFPTTSLVAVLSVAGLALSLSIQNIMTNLFSGITLLMTHPFGAEDFISIGEEQGTVKSVGLFYTCIDTVDNKAISIPNGDVASSRVINYSREAIRRVDMSFYASYDSPTQTVRGAIMEAVSQDEKILAEPEPFVAIRSYGDSRIEYAVRVWCPTPDYWDVYFGMNERIRECFEKYGVDMSYDHVNVHVIK